MGKSHSLDIRERVVAMVEAGHSSRSAARRFAIGDSTAIRVMQRRCKTGAVSPPRQGRPPGRGKLAAYRAFLIAQVKATERARATVRLLPARLTMDAPFGHWGTQTFIARLCCFGLTAPWIINCPMNRAPFDTYLEIAFPKIKAHLRAAQARTFDALTKALGSICNLFNRTENFNFFNAAGYPSC
jgi:transposase